jgi:hypothetical protein
MTIETEVESSIKTIIADHLDRRADAFRKCNLRPSEITLKILNEREGQRESEICLYFYREKNLFDALEFHVYKKGKLALLVGEINEWLDNALSGVVKRATDTELQCWERAVGQRSVSHQSNAAPNNAPWNFPVQSGSPMRTASSR